MKGEKGYTVGTYIVKKNKPKSDVPICNICKNCTNRQFCKNRKNIEQMKKCDKCKGCSDIQNCDKFYISVQHKATLNIGKDITTGKLIRKSFTGKSEADAMDKMYKFKLEMKQKGKTFEYVKTEKTISILAQEIEDSKYKMGTTKANAYNTNMATLERIKKNKFANIPIEKVTKKQVQEFLEKERVKSNSIIKKDYRMLKYVFEYATHNLYIMHNFFEGIGKVEITKSFNEDKDVKAFTKSEQKKLEEYISICDNKHRNIILLCLYTGMRIGEALALNYKDDIDFDEMTITINKTITKDKNKKTIIGTPRTKSGKRKIQITELIEPILKSALQSVVKNKHNSLFAQENGQLYGSQAINSAFKRICKYAGINKDVNTHMLRHSFATRCIEAGVSLAVLQKLMGHMDIATTINTYGDIYTDFQQIETQKYVNYIKSS